MIFGAAFDFRGYIYYSGQLNTMLDPKSHRVGRSRDVHGMKCMSSQGPDPIASHRECVRVHRDDRGSAFGIRSTYLPVFDLNMEHPSGPRFVPLPEIHVPLSNSYECSPRRTSESPPVWDSGKIDDSHP